MTNWQSVLKSAGFPTTALILDFETYFSTDYSLKKLSTVEYVCDDRFEILGLGMQLLDIEDGKIDFWSPEFICEHLTFNLKDTFGENLQDITLVGQNLKFDVLILREHFGITPKYTVDTKDLSRHLDARNKHSLDAMGKRWGASSPKGDTYQFKGLHWADMNQEQRQALERYTKTDIEIETFLFKKLLPLIANPEIELPLANQTLQLYLNPQVVIDKNLGEEIKQKMQIKMIKPIQQLNANGVSCNKEEISGDKSFLALLEQHLEPDEQVPMKQGKNGMIPALAKDDRGMNYLRNEHPNSVVRQLAEARIAIKSWPLHIKRVNKLVNQANCRGGKIGMPLTYYAAHVGKWGGTEQINVQNLGGRGRKGAGTHPLIREIRQMFCASSGYVFGDGDFSQIEFRINAWLSGQNDILQAFTEGRDLYSEFATDELFHEPIRKPLKTDPPEVARILTFKRGFAKDGTLGFGYGMGTNRLYEDCYANDTLRPAFDSGEYDWDFINKIIKKLRKKYSKIPAFWRTVEKAWKFVTKYPKENFYYSIGNKNKITPGYSYLHFYNQNGTTTIQLPSGRNIYYPQAIVTHQGKLKSRWDKKGLWGGTLTENIVTAIARDILAEALLRLQVAGFNILFHVHDEIICLFPKYRANKDLQKMVELMEVVPKWAKGLPIATDSKLCERYEK